MHALVSRSLVSAPYARSLLFVCSLSCSLARSLRLDGTSDETGASPTAWAHWTRHWTAEENRHGDLLNKYLYLTGKVRGRGERGKGGRGEGRGG